MDHTLSDQHAMPSNFVVLDVPGYDGAQYYQIARNVPKIIIGESNTLTEKSPGSYAYQRFALPVLAASFSIGDNSLLPWAFLLINILTLALSSFLLLRWNKDASLYAVALGLCPAAVLGLHYMLAGPLALFLISLFLVRYLKDESN